MAHDGRRAGLGSLSRAAPPGRRVVGGGTKGGVTAGERTPCSGVAPYLNAVQPNALAAWVELGDFKTVGEVIAGVKGRWGVVYRYQGRYWLMKRHHLKWNVPRPQSEKAAVEQPAVWKKGVWRYHSVRPG